MRRVEIYRDEWYPVYAIDYIDDGEDEVPEELIRRFELVAAEFDEVQRLLGAIWRENRGR